MNATVWVRGPDGKRVCSVKRCETDFDNARLIAAAPDLLAALKLIAERPRSKPTVPQDIVTIQRIARAAIAKATE